MLQYFTIVCVHKDLKYISVCIEVHSFLLVQCAQCICVLFVIAADL